jgi:hypothetical protein
MIFTFVLYRYHRLRCHPLLFIIIDVTLIAVVIIVASLLFVANELQLITRGRVRIGRERILRRMTK